MYLSCGSVLPPGICWTSAVMRSDSRSHMARIVQRCRPARPRTDLPAPWPGCARQTLRLRSLFCTLACALGSVVEHRLHTAGVPGSNPGARTTTSHLESATYVGIAPSGPHGSSSPWMLRGCRADLRPVEFPSARTGASSSSNSRWGAPPPAGPRAARDARLGLRADPGPKGLRGCRSTPRRSVQR
jgi:hypothetical protein